MKNLILSLIAISTFSASAITLNASANLTRLDIQNGSYLALQKVSGGEVSVDLRGRGELSVLLQPAFECPAGMMCAQVMPAILTYKVDLQKIEIGGCHETIYKGVRNDDVADGFRIEITVVDNSTNICEYVLPIDSTEVTLAISGGIAGFSEVHHFAAEKLQESSSSPRPVLL